MNIKEFKCGFRFTDEKYALFSEEELSEMEVLSKESANASWFSYCDDELLPKSYFIKKKGLNELQLISADCGWGDEEAENNTKYLFETTLRQYLNGCINICYDSESALKVSAKLFCDKWTDFCYPSDYLIIDCGDRAILYYEDLIYYLDKIEKRCQYIIEILFSGKKYYLLWNDDCFAANDGKALLFYDMETLRKFVHKNSLLISEDISSYNFDDIDRNINNISNTENCRELLDIWNIFSDMAEFMEADFRGDYEEDSISDMYTELVQGSNIEILENDEFHPVPDNVHKDLLTDIMCDGIRIFRMLTDEN